MRIFCRGLLLILAVQTGLILQAETGRAGERFQLVQQNHPSATIVMAEHPSENARAAASEFQSYVEKISGARLPIVSDAQAASGMLVLIGSSKLTEKLPDLKVPSGRTKDLREEGFIIFCRGNRLVLAGNDQEPYYGTRYAVAELLHRLGVRWFMPGKFGEVVPRRNAIDIDPMNIQERPDFEMRNFWEHSRGNMGEELSEWKIHHKMNPRMQDWFGVPGDGSITGFLPEELFKAHPDWFALNRDGKRDPHMVCMTSPGMIHYFAERIRDRAREGKRVTPFAPEDGMPRCYCSKCMKMSTAFDGYGTNDRDPWPESSTSQEWFYFVDHVLKEVNRDFPEHLIASNGYANRDIAPELPDFNPSKNLVIMFANICACTIHAYDDPHCWMMQRQAQMVKRWCQLSDKVWMYDYNYTMLVSKGTITPMVHRIRRNIPLLKQYGIVGFHDQEVCDWSQSGLPTRLVRAALEWDTRANVNAILDDFFQRWFGPAAKPMQAYYDALEEAFEKTDAHGHEDVILNHIYTPGLVSRLGKLIGTAEKRATAEPEKTRVHLERMIYDVLLDYVAMEKAKRECHFAEAAGYADRIDIAATNMNQITPFMGYWPYQAYGPSWEAKRLRELAAKTEGPEGRLLTVLPQQAVARRDPFDDGRYERWMDPNKPRRKEDWRPIKTLGGWDNQGFMDANGHPFKGILWYDLETDIPAGAKGEAVWLMAPSVVEEAWVWVNGQYAGHRPYMMPWFRPQALDLEITPFIKLGQPNQITFRVLNNMDVWGASGIYERMFLYAKKQTNE